MRREDIVISTKVFFKTVPTKPIDLAKGNEIGLSRKHIIEGFLNQTKIFKHNIYKNIIYLSIQKKYILCQYIGIKASIKRLDMEYVDLVFAHRFIFIIFKFNSLEF